MTRPLLFVEDAVGDGGPRLTGDLGEMVLGPTPAPPQPLLLAVAQVFVIVLTKK